MFTTPPVLFLHFNRPDLAEQVFAAIRKARPAQLFFAADGPRPDHNGEAELCRRSRQLVNRVDWPCEKKTRFLDTNLGCKKAVSSAITWFFGNVTEGIVLEDDCLPDPSFFPYCAELLEKYRHEPRIALISGNNFQNPSTWKPDAYYFSIYTHIWGWASWQRAWRAYSSNMEQWPRFKKSRQFRKLLVYSSVTDHWSQVFDQCYRGEIDTWDCQWAFSCWAKGMLSILPSCNLVSNIGFDARGTHTVDQYSFGSRIPLRSISLPLRHPMQVQPNQKADNWTHRVVFGIPDVGLVQQVRRRISHAISILPQPIGHAIRYFISLRHRHP
jgi:hypothetical protein